MKRSFLILGLVMIVISLSSALRAESLFRVREATDNYIDIEFDLKDYESILTEMDGTRYYRLFHPDAAYLMNEGKPELPFFTTSIAIPNTGTARIDDIRVLDREIQDDILIFPSQGDDVASITESEFVIDDLFYLKDKVYPEETCRIGTPAIMRDIRFVSITLTPFRYNPYSQELEINRNISLRVEFDQTQVGENELTRPLRKLSRSYETIYQSVLLNYNDFISPNWEYQSRSILVVHHHSALLEPVIDMYVEWKRQKGFEITATSTSGMTTATAIKNYIQNAYDTWEIPPEYVILIGGGSGSFAIPTFPGYPSLASDHPYSLLEGGDDISDVFVGRLPIYNTEHLMTIWNKIRNYEKTPYTIDTDWYRHALLCGSPGGWGISTLFTPKYVKEQMLLFNEDFSFSEVYYAPFATQINNALNQGTFMFNYRGYYGFYYDWTSSSPNLNNGLKLPYAFFLTCHTLDYNNSSTSETERFVNLGTPIASKGGIAAMGHNTGDSKTAYNNALSGSMVYGIYNEGIRTIGETMVRGKIFLHETFGIVHPTHPPQFSHWLNLMGDPSLDIWVDKPKTMNVDYEIELPLGRNFIDVLVTDSLGLPIKDAWVTIRQGDDVIFATGYTEEDGSITHFFDPDNSGEVTITVTKPDYIPHIGSFELSGEPGVSLYDIIITDPIEAGANVSFITTVKNYSNNAAMGVTGEITTSSPYIEIVQGSSSFWNIINPGGIVEGLEEFTITISQSAPNLIPAIFTLELTDAEGNSWESKFLFRINGSCLKPVSLLVGDSNNYIDPEETASLRISVENQGQVDIEEVYGVLRTNDPLFDISDTLAYFGDIEVGETVISDLTNSFVVTAFESLITGMTVELELILYNNFGYEATEPITLPIGLITQNDPLGPCDYGYYIYGMEDTEYEYAPTYEWIEIAPQLGGSGQNAGLSSDFNNVQDITVVDLPFTFRFYGIDYDQITISANGWISFGVTEQGTFRNWILPGPMGPNPIVAAFWDNLSLAQGGVYYYHDVLEDIFIIQWHNARNIVGSAEETFQIILYNPALEPTLDDGFIKIQYKAFNNVNNTSGYPSGNWGNYCTVGIGDHSSEVGLTYTFGNQYPTAAGSLSNESAIMIVGPKNYHEPFLVRQSVHIFDENETGYIDAGENVNLGIYIRNIGFAAATNVTGTISTTSPYIQLLNNSSSYYDIDSGTEEVNREFFEINVSASTPNSYIADFMIDIQGNNIDVSFPFHLSISRPSLTFSSYIIEELVGNGDGFIDPGETGNFILDFSNPTMTEVMNTTVGISSESEYITINTTEISLGNIPKQAHLQKGVEFSISSDCPAGEHIPVTVSVDADNIIGYEEEIYFGVSLEDIFIDFESDDGGFISNDENGWQWGESSIGAHSGTNVWATRLEENYDNMANWTLDSQSYLITPSTLLSFHHYYTIEEYWDGGNVKISFDDGENWQLIHPLEGYPVESVNSANAGIPFQPAYSGNSNGWLQADFDLSEFFGKLVRFRWHFGSGPWVNFPGWFIDDIELSRANQLYASISGTVELLQSPISPDEIVITAGDYSTKADTEGQYKLVVPPGSYTVTAHLPYHYSELSYEVILDDLEEMSDIDFTLLYLTPAENLLYTLYEDNTTIDLSWDFNPIVLGRADSDVDDFSSKTRIVTDNTRSLEILRDDPEFLIFRQTDSGVFQQIASTTELSYTGSLPFPQSTYRFYIVAEYPEGTSNKSNTVSTDDPHNVVDEQQEIPLAYALHNNYPNPFNPVTNISFSLPEEVRVTIKIYNIRGELVKTIVDEIMTAGFHTIQWEGRNNNNRQVSSGIYFYNIKAGPFNETGKALLLK